MASHSRGASGWRGPTTSSECRRRSTVRPRSSLRLAEPEPAAHRARGPRASAHGDAESDRGPLTVPLYARSALRLLARELLAVLVRPSLAETPAVDLAALGAHVSLAHGQPPASSARDRRVRSCVLPNRRRMIDVACADADHTPCEELTTSGPAPTETDTQRRHCPPRLARADRAQGAGAHGRDG